MEQQCQKCNGTVMADPPITIGYVLCPVCNGAQANSSIGVATAPPYVFYDRNGRVMVEGVDYVIADPQTICAANIMSHEKE